MSRLTTTPAGRVLMADPHELLGCRTTLEMRMVARIPLLILLTSTACANSGEHTSCQVCQTGCSGGLVTLGDVLTPPGCGSQCQTSFCPGGCSSDAKTCLNFNGPDGGPGSCIASNLTATSGAFGSHGVAVAQDTTIRLASSAPVACELASDAGLATLGSPASAIVIDFPPNMAGTIDVTSGSPLAKLVTRNDGGVTELAATSGSVEVNVSQPGGGLIGSYSLMFGSDLEEGSFTAPACDVCATPP